MLPDTPWKKPSSLEAFAHVGGAHHTPIRQTNRLDTRLIVTSDDEELANEVGPGEEEDMVFTQPFALALRDSSDDPHHRPAQPTRRSLVNEFLSSSGISQPSSEIEPMFEQSDEEEEEQEQDDDETDDEAGLFGVEWPKQNHPLSEDEQPESSLSNLRSSPPPQHYRDSHWTSNGHLSSFTNDLEGEDDLDEVDAFFSSSRPNDDKSYDLSLTGSSFATVWPHFLTREYFEECQKNEGKGSACAQWQHTAMNHNELPC